MTGAPRSARVIRLDRVTKSFAVAGRRRIVLRDVSLDLPLDRGVALLGRNGAGKSTLLRLISGHLRPDAGRIRRGGSVSWQVGSGLALHPELTGAQNTRFVARIHGVDTRALAGFVADFAALGGHFAMPVRTYSQGMKARLSFGLSMALSFDLYLVDEITAAGDAAFREKSRAFLRDRIARAGAIVVSHNTEDLRATCDAGLVLREGRLVWHDRLQDAIADYEDDPAGTAG
jgi:capsular polysaccharide transport system ATP-binding protein